MTERNKMGRRMRGAVDGGCVLFFCRVLEKGSLIKVTFEQRCESSKELSPKKIRGNNSTRALMRSGA